MITSILHTAAEVISGVTRDQQADSVLRNVLRKKTGLARTDGREISRAVFAYYRWLHWLNKGDSLEQQVSKAVDLTLRFRHDPHSFSEEDLAKAVPAWAKAQLDVTPQWLRAVQTDPILWLRVPRGQTMEVLSRLMNAERGPLPGSIRFNSEEDLFRLPEFHQGKFELQDISSQAVALACAPQPGQTWWDACAGEGGKTLHLSDLMQNKGLIWATDKADWRLKQLKIRASRAQCFNYRSKIWQGPGKLPTKTMFDGVLLDAPCSGIGTWQRNPHARWTTTENDIQELAVLQQKLLSQAAGAVKKGGRLIYAVCTLSRLETTGVADFFDKAHPEFAPCAFPNPFKPQEQQNRLFLRPQEVSGNGMFIASWTKM